MLFVSLIVMRFQNKSLHAYNYTAILSFGWNKTNFYFHSFNKGILWTKMANNTDITTILLPDLVRALVILQMMGECVLILVYICGIIASLFNVFTLLQKQFPRNPCSLYFLSASTTDFSIMNLVLLMDRMRYFNPKLFCLSSTYISLSCIDCFCTSSHREKLRWLSRILIPLVLII